jgi:putative transposase
MRYAASEKLEIIRTVETSHLPVRRTLGKIGIAKSTFYTWLDRYASGGLDALEDHRPAPHRVWNRIPDDVRERIVALALDEPDLSPREVAVAFTDRERSFVSEASVYRLLKARGLVTSPAFIVMKAADKLAPGSGHEAHARQALPPHDPRQDRAMAPIIEEPNPARKLLSSR